MRAKEFDSEASVGALCRAFDSTFGSSASSAYRVKQTNTADSGATLRAVPSRRGAGLEPAVIRLRASDTGSTHVRVTALALPSRLLLVIYFTFVGVLAAAAAHLAAVDARLPAEAALVTACVLGGPIALLLLLRVLFVSPPRYAVAITNEVLTLAISVPSSTFVGATMPKPCHSRVPFRIDSYSIAQQPNSPARPTVHVLSTAEGRVFVTPAPLSEVVGVLRAYQANSSFLNVGRTSLRTTFNEDSTTSRVLGDLRYTSGSGKRATTYRAEVVCSTTPQGTSVFVKPLPMATWRFFLMGVMCAAMTYGAFVYAKESWHGPFFGVILAALWLEEFGRGRTQGSKERVLTKVEDVLREQVAEHFARQAA
jgi:hypothetical protein